LWHGRLAHGVRPRALAAQPRIYPLRPAALLRGTGFQPVIVFATDELNPCHDKRKSLCESDSFMIAVIRLRDLGILPEHSARQWVPSCPSGQA
jgi:hypothetical protein